MFKKLYILFPQPKKKKKKDAYPKLVVCVKVSVLIISGYDYKS